MQSNAAVRERHDEAIDGTLHRGHGALQDLRAIGDLPAPGRDELTGRDAISREEPVDSLGCSIARAAGVDDDYGACRMGQRQGSAESSGTTTDHRHVVARLRCHRHHELAEITPARGSRPDLSQAIIQPH